MAGAGSSSKHKGMTPIIGSPGACGVNEVYDHCTNDFVRSGIRPPSEGHDLLMVISRRLPSRQEVLWPGATSSLPSNGVQKQFAVSCLSRMLIPVGYRMALVNVVPSRFMQ